MDPLIEEILTGQVAGFRASADVFENQAASAEAVAADARAQKTAALAQADELQAAIDALRAHFPEPEPPAAADDGSGA